MPVLPRQLESGIDLVEDADIVHQEDVLADDVKRLFHRLMVFVAVSLHFRGDQNELGAFGDELVDMSILFAVNIERVSCLVPEHSVAMINRRVYLPVAADARALAIQSVSA